MAEESYGLMLIDEYLPVYEASERHELIVAAEPATVYAAIRKADFGQVLPIRWLLWLRFLPARLSAGWGSSREISC